MWQNLKSYVRKHMIFHPIITKWRKKLPFFIHIMFLKMARKWKYPLRFCRLYHEDTPKIFVWDVYSKYKPHGFQVFRALFEKAVRRLAFSARPEAQYPDLVTGGYQIHHAFLFYKSVLIFFHLGHLSGEFWASQAE